MSSLATPSYKPLTSLIDEIERFHGRLEHPKKQPLWPVTNNIMVNESKWAPAPCKGYNKR